MVARHLVMPLFALAAMLMVASDQSNADDPGVSLILNKASAQRDGHVLFRCEASIDNATGGELTVKSIFFRHSTDWSWSLPTRMARRWPSSPTFSISRRAGNKKTSC